MPRPKKPPRLYLRKGRGSQQSRWVILDGSREIGTGAGAEDVAAAERELNDYLIDKHDPPAAGSRLDQVLIDDVITIYLEEVAKHSTSREFLCHSLAPILTWWSGRTLATIRGATCRAYVAWRTSQPVRNAKRKPRLVTEGTARNELKIFRASINHYHAEYGPLSSVPKVTMPGHQVQRAEYFLRRDEVAQRLMAAWRRPRSKHIARFILIGIYSGSRPGVILGLQWLPSASGGWIDLERGVIHRKPEGARQTKKRAPPVRIHRRLLPFLRRWRAEDLAHGLVNVISYAGQPVGKLRNSWASVRIESGHQRHDSPHIVRHTAATWQMQAGTSLTDAAEYLGMSPDTLWQVYGHLHPDFQKSASEAESPRTRKPQETTGSNVIKLAKLNQ